MLKALWKPSSKSTPNYTFNFRVSCLPAWCQCAKVPKGCQLLIFTCQCSNKCANVRKACQLFNLVFQSAKGVPNFQLCMSTYQKGNWFFNYFLKRIFQFFSHAYICNWNVKTQNVKWSWIYFFIYLPDTPCVKRPI